MDEPGDRDLEELSDRDDNPTSHRNDGDGQPSRTWGAASIDGPVTNTGFSGDDVEFFSPMPLDLSEICEICGFSMQESIGGDLENSVIEPIDMTHTTMLPGLGRSSIPSTSSRNNNEEIDDDNYSRPSSHDNNSELEDDPNFWDNNLDGCCDYYDPDLPQPWNVPALRDMFGSPVPSSVYRDKENAAEEGGDTTFIPLGQETSHVRAMSRPGHRDNDSISGVPTVEDYHGFYWKCMTLKSELIRLDFALRSVAASGLGIQAVHDLKQKLRQLRDLYGINTAVLFPEATIIKRYTPIDPLQYLERIPLCFKDFGQALGAMTKALDVFNDVYHDENLTLYLFALETRFKRESLDLIEFTSDMDTDDKDAKIYIQVLLKEWVEEAIESLSKSVSHFHEKGIEKIDRAQKTKTSAYFDMTTIATFFSAVTASMIQTTASDSTTAIGVAANTFFFSSLVFSIASAVNSLLVSSWIRSVVHEPENALTLWLRAWLSIGPMVSLIISGIFFSLGLCLSAFSTNQHLVTSLVTTGFSGMHATTILLLAFLHVRAKWTFRIKAGGIGKDLTKDSVILAVFEWLVIRLKLAGIRVGRSRASPESIDIAQAEEGNGMIELSLGEKLKGDLLHGLLPQESGNYNPFIQQNALADEDFVLPYSYCETRSTRQTATIVSPVPAQRQGLTIGRLRLGHVESEPESSVDRPVNRQPDYVRASERMGNSVYDEDQPHDQTGNKYDEHLDLARERAAPKSSGVQSAARFLPPMESPPIGYKEHYEVDALPSRYTGMSSKRTNSTESLATSLIVNS